MTKIALVDFGGTGLAYSDIDALAVALETQINSQFALPQPMGWGISVSGVRAAKDPTDFAVDEWVCGFFKTADQPGALGYHDKTPTGQPFMKCFPLLDKQDGVPWQPTASHEVLETLLDAELNMCFQAPDGKIWAAEDCDAVENDTYMINGVPLSNWVTPLWFGDVQVGRFDYMGLCKAPYDIRPGGYGQYWDPEIGWRQVISNEKKPRDYRLMHAGRGMARVARAGKDGK